MHDFITRIGSLLHPVAIAFAIFSPQTSPYIPTPSAYPTVTIAPSPTPSVLPTQTPTPFVPTSTPKPTPTYTPILTPTPTTIPVTSLELDTWFGTYSALYAVDLQLLKRIAVCESNLRPTATNGIYGGLFQYSPSTWIHTRTRMNMDTNIALRFVPEEAIKTAAYTLSTSGTSPWKNCASAR